MKRTLMRLLSYAFYYFDRARHAPKAPIVLYYHRVTDCTAPYNNTNPYISLPSSLFENHIRCLCETAKVVSLNEYLDYVLKGASLPNNSVLITFDDGYRDNYVHAFPILRKYGVPAAIFLTSDMIGSTKTFWWDDLYGIIHKTESVRAMWQIAKDLQWRYPFNKSDFLKYSKKSKKWKQEYFAALTERMKSMTQREIENILTGLKNLVKMENIHQERVFLSWHEVRELSYNGISFGSHSCSHPNVTILSKNELIDEVTLSKRIIEEKTQIQVRSFSYPYGIFGDRCKAVLRNCGYDIAFATKVKDKSWDRYSIPRVPIKPSMSLGITGAFSRRLFRMECSGYLDRLKMQILRFRPSDMKRH